MSKKPKWLRKYETKESKAKDDWSEYKHRNRVLKDAGFNSYSEYLNSNTWEEIRKKKLSESTSCCLCDKIATELHHAFYYRSILLGDDDAISRDLYPICHECHTAIEFNGKTKLSSGSARRKFFRLLFKKKHGISKSQMIKIDVLQRRAKKQSKKKYSN